MRRQRPAQIKPVTRRSVLKGTSALAALGWARANRLFAAAPVSANPTVFYMDGYHGGVRGHMPEGCWRDILQTLRSHPEWKLSLDVEAESWTVLQRQDPATFRHLASLLSGGTTSRVEMTGGTFSQPYGWAISGESNIRQLQRGLELIRRSFPGLRVATYAVQEPCWASCLPQILRSFGFTGASLKNASTAWGGYTRGFDAELVNWIGPDGSSLLAVPRYEQEHLLNVWETEATEVTPEYARRCVEHGIPQPAGMCFQDLGWAAQPRVNAPWAQFATWQEYLHTVARTKPVDWQFTMEDILTALPWGEKTLQRASQQVREAETSLVQAEKCAAMAYIARGLAWPSQAFEHAWDQTMWAQAHDAWITVTTRSGRQAWAFQVASETLDASDAARSIIAESVAALCVEAHSAKLAEPEERYVRAVHTTGRECNALMEVTLATDPGTEAFEVHDSRGQVLLSQVHVTRKYLHMTDTVGVHTPIMDGKAATEAAGSTSINTATVLFRDNLPGFGWQTYKVIALQTAIPAEVAPGLTLSQDEDGSVNIETDLYRMSLDARHGGAIRSLYAKQLSTEICPKGGLLNEYRGFFSEKKEWCSSAQSEAKLQVLERGPVRARVQIVGSISDCPFRAVITVVQGEPRIDCEVTFRFDQDSWIGDPWEIKPEDRSKERRRSSNDGRPKLQAIFPMTLQHGVIYKSAAFDVCRSRNASTHFQRWDEIKHNIITNWVDLYDPGQGMGLAILSDRTTAYSIGEGEPLGLILGWGGEAGYWWGKCPLRGEQEARYAILPHRGNWAEAGLWRHNQSWEETVITEEMPSTPGTQQGASLLRVHTAHTAISSVMIVQNEVQVRLFCASPEGERATLEIGFPCQSARLVELDGRDLQPLHLVRGDGGESLVQLDLPAFAIRTIRFHLSLPLQDSKEQA